MKKTTSILKVFTVAVFLLVGPRIFAQQQVIQNLTVVDSLVISSLSDTSMIGSAITAPFRQLIIDQYGTVRSGDEYIPKINCYMSGDSLGIVYSEIPSWQAKPFVLYVECPMDAKVGIGTQNPVNKLDVLGSGYFSGNLGIGTPTPTQNLQVVGNAIFSGNLGIGVVNPTQPLHVVGNGILSGNLGIGTTSPQAKLDVNGQIKSDIQFHLGGNYDPVNGRGITVDNGGATSWELLTLKNITGTHLRVIGNGNVGIGCNSPQYKLQVNGSVKAMHVLVTATGCDFVFEDKYKLPSIAERKAFIKEYKHLPNIKPAKDMQENGMDISTTTEGLLQNIEEITLYQITHDEKIILLLKQQEELKSENQKLKEEIDLIKALLKK